MRRTIVLLYHIFTSTRLHCARCTFKNFNFDCCIWAINKSNLFIYSSISLSWSGMSEKWPIILTLKYRRFFLISPCLNNGKSWKSFHHFTVRPIESNLWSVIHAICQHKVKLLFIISFIDVEWIWAFYSIPDRWINPERRTYHTWA